MGLFADLGSLGTAAFGGGKKKTSGTQTTKGTTTKQLEIDEAGVQKILQDILGSEQGLANIFSKENVSGLFKSSVGAQASGDLVANLAGEIAKLTAKEVTTTDETVASQAKSKDKGFLSSIFG